jgi:hypothetical protein
MVNLIFKVIFNISKLIFMNFEVKKFTAGKKKSRNKILLSKYHNLVDFLEQGAETY